MQRSNLKYLIISACLGMLLPQHSQAGVDQFCLKGKRIASCMTALLTLKCRQYQPAHLLTPEPFRIAACASEAKKAVKILDPIAYADDTVIYAKELLALLGRREVATYLNSIQSVLESASESRFDLWQHTLAHTQQDQKLASRWLAVIFQDTSPDPASLQWAIDSKKVPQKTLDAYAMILEALTPAAVTESKDLLKVYPNGLDAILNPTFYHFYTMRYWAQALADGRHMKLKEAFFYPFALNTAYEYRSLNVKHWPIQEPNRATILKNRDNTIRDVYAGYLGAMLGSGFSSGQKDAILSLSDLENWIKDQGPVSLFRAAKTGSLKRRSP